MQLTLEEFRAYLLALKEQEAREERVARALDEVLDGRFVPQFCPELSRCYLELLGRLCGCGAPGPDADFLSWWIYENDYGHKGLEMFDEDGTEIPVASVEEAYAYLISLAIKPKPCPGCGASEFPSDSARDLHLASCVRYGG